MMENTKKYFVHLENVRENERIIFKLICSVSQRSKGRSNSYTILTEIADTAPDIVIGDLDNKAQSLDTEARLFTAWIADDSAHENTVLRPLIATRVLTTLDRLVDQYISSDILDSEITESSEASENQDISVTEFTFDISEEEASELAIVQDEALSNPANEEEALIIQSLPSSITYIGSANTQDNETDGVVDTKLPRALVVDDSPSVRKQLELELDLFDVDVDYAASAEEAFGFLQNEHYDIAFLDVVLPDKDGFQICKHIKSTSKDTIAIMLTGKATQGDKIKGSLSGCDAYLVKPVGRATFQSAARNSLALKEQENIVEA